MYLSTSVDLSSIKVSDSTKAILQAICNSETEMEHFLVECWSGEWEDQFEAVQEFRKWKQKNLSLSKEDFLGICETFGIREALQQLCQYPIPETDFQMIDKMMVKKKLSWADMYDKHIKRPTYLPLSMVL